MFSEVPGLAVLSDDTSSSDIATEVPMQSGTLSPPLLVEQPQLAWTSSAHARPETSSGHLAQCTLVVMNCLGHLVTCQAMS